MIMPVLIYLPIFSFVYRLSNNLLNVRIEHLCHGVVYAFDFFCTVMQLIVEVIYQLKMLMAMLVVHTWKKVSLIS